MQIAQARAGLGLWPTLPIVGFAGLYIRLFAYTIIGELYDELFGLLAMWMILKSSFGDFGYCVDI